METSPQSQREPWLAWICALPFPAVGSVGGLYLGLEQFDQYARRHAALHGGEGVCGLGALPPMFFGVVCGSLAGIIAGAIVAAFVARWLRKARKLRVAVSAE